MLTKSDLQSIGKLIDQKLSTDIASIQSRIDSIEKNLATRSDVTLLRVGLEKLIEAQEVKLVNIESSMIIKTEANAFATVFDLKKAFRGVVRQKHLKAMENRIQNKLNRTSDATDSLMVNLEKRAYRIETHLHLPPIENL